MGRFSCLECYIDLAGEIFSLKTLPRQTPILWRGSLLPLGCVATAKNPGAAAQPSGSKLPRHDSSARLHRKEAVIQTVLKGVKIFGNVHFEKETNK